MTAIRDYAARARARMGAAGFAGLALLAAALVLWLSIVEPAREERDRLQRASEQAARQLRSVVDPGRTGSAREQLAAFRGFFPLSDSTPQWLARIEAAATRNGVQLSAGEYRVARAAATRLVRYQISLPVQGTYAQLRAFVASVLEDVPAAAVEEVTLKREAVGNARLEARIRITLFLADAAGAEGGS